MNEKKKREFLMGFRMGASIVGAVALAMLIIFLISL